MKNTILFIEKYKNMVYCIGDSHSSIFAGGDCITGVDSWCTNEPFNVFHAGPILAFNLDDKSNVKGALQNVPKEHYILTCFGEIDCRAQVHRFITETKDYKQVIDEITLKYISVLDSIDHPNKIVFSLTPCLMEKPFENWFNADASRNDIFCATKGTKEERNTYKEYFNKRMKALCRKRKYKFISIYEEVLNKGEYYIDDVHLGGAKVAKILKSKFKFLK